MDLAKIRYWPKVSFESKSSIFFKIYYPNNFLHALNTYLIRHLAVELNSEFSKQTTSSVANNVQNTQNGVCIYSIIALKS